MLFICTRYFSSSTLLFILLSK